MIMNDIYLEHNFFKQNEWKKILVAHTSNFGFPIEVAWMDVTKVQQDKKNIEPVLNKEKIQSEKELEDYIEKNVTDIKLDKDNMVFIVTKDNARIFYVEDFGFCVIGIKINEINYSSDKSIYHQFFDIVFSKKDFPIEVTFCGEGTLDSDNLFRFSLKDVGWENYFENNLLYLLEDEKINRECFLLSKFTSRKDKCKSLNDFIQTFNLTDPNNFLLACDSKNRYTFVDHIYTSSSIISFGNLN